LAVTFGTGFLPPGPEISENLGKSPLTDIDPTCRSIYTYLYLCIYKYIPYYKVYG
jgi:hypothetical protein